MKTVTQYVSAAYQSVTAVVCECFVIVINCKNTLKLEKIIIKF